MRRPMRWYWAALAALGSFFGSALLTGWLAFGSWPGGRGVLEPALEWLWDNTYEVIGETSAFYALLLLLSALPFLVGLLTYALIRRPAYRDEYLHCLKCGYILKGLSEPRCPECGERI